MKLKNILLLTGISLALSHIAGAGIEYDPAVPQIAYAAGVLAGKIDTSKYSIQFKIDSEKPKAEAFSIRKSKDGVIEIIGSDPAGAMYGGFELAEILAAGGSDIVGEIEQSPYLGMRGVKFNLPLDVRTPTYTDMGDAAQHNLPHMWDYDFWTEYIDELALHRYNYISLWNLHPFPSLIKLQNYPDIALDDVKRAVGLEKKHYDGRGIGFDAEEILDETETLIEMTIDEKIDFWRKVMRYGKSRNIDFYIVTWNVFDYGTEGKYGIDDSLDNEETKKYFRESVKTLFLTYPDLKGIGITTGENMHDATNQEKEDWMYATYGLGVLDVFKHQPERKITFLHRQHQAGATAIAATFKPLVDHPQVDFIFSYKYAQAHAYSSVMQPFYGSFARDIKSSDGDLKTIWTMRNDSTYLFRWSAPDFLRAFVQAIPVDITRGYYFGSDGWVFGREFIDKDPDIPGQLEIKKHWMQMLLWGRLAYDPNISNERFAEIVGTRFPGIDGKAFLENWQKASMVFPNVTGFNWGNLDYRWYPEACIGVPNAAQTETGFYDVNRFITRGPHPGSGFASIPEYVEAQKTGKKLEKREPLSVSREMIRNADEALRFVERIDPGRNWELGETIEDIQAMAYLSRHYGKKIEGATRIALYREFGRVEDKEIAIRSLEDGFIAWKAYVANITSRFHTPIWYGRVYRGPVDWNEITEWAKGDIDIAKAAIHAP